MTITKADKEKQHTLLLLLIIVMSAVDAQLTLYWISEGVGEELNPLLAFFIELGEEWFILAKAGLTLMGCLILHVSRKNKNSKRAALGLFALYFALILYHGIGGVYSL